MSRAGESGLMERLFLWLRRRGNHPSEPLLGAQARVEAEERLATEAERTADAQALGRRARASRRHNHYAAAIRSTLRRNG